MPLGLCSRLFAVAVLRTDRSQPGRLAGGGVAEKGAGLWAEPSLEARVARRVAGWQRGMVREHANRPSGGDF